MKNKPCLSSVEWTQIISPRRPWWAINWAEIWSYRDLILLFVRRDFVAYYKQTILGPLWFFLQPILMTIVFTVIFGKIAKIPTDGVPSPLFYLSGLIAWGYFSSCLNATSNTFVSNAHIFGKVYFPRLCVPIAVVISNMMQFLIQLGLFIGFYIFYLGLGTRLYPTIWVLFLPLILIQMAVLGLGCGILVSSLTTRYRDLALAVTFGIQLWMYLTPIVYPLTRVPEAYRDLYALNPMVGIIEFFRYALLGHGSLQMLHMILSFIVTFVIFFIGIIIFHKVEQSFMDTV